MREFIQAKLNELTDIDCGVIQFDDIVEVGKTYFGYELYENFVKTNFSRNDTKRITINGYLVRKVKNTEDTLSILDSASVDLENKLKELNFKVSKQDITIDENIRKIKIDGDVFVNQNTFIF